jgi:hypothetical protein
MPYIKAMIQHYRRRNASALHGNFNERIGKKHRRVTAENRLSPYRTITTIDHVPKVCDRTAESLFATDIFPLTPQGRVLEKLTVTHLIKKLSDRG